MGNCCSNEHPMNQDSKPMTRDRPPQSHKFEAGYMPSGAPKERGPKYIEHRYPNGSLYKGPMLYNKRDGNGQIVWADGSKYIGMFKQDLMHGYGVFTW